MTTHTPPTLARAHALLGLNRPAEARRVVDQILAEQPTDLRTRAFDIELMLRYENRLRDAARSAKELVAAAPHWSMAHRLLGQVHSLRGHHKKAIEAHDESVRLAPHDAFALLARGHAMAQWAIAQPYGTKPRQAERDFDAALRLMPLLADAHAHRARMLLGLRKPKRALAAAAQALALDPENQLAHAVRGGALAERGRHSDAANAYAQASRLDPADRRSRRKAKNHATTLLTREGLVLLMAAIVVSSCLYVIHHLLVPVAHIIILVVAWRMAVRARKRRTAQLEPTTDQIVHDPFAQSRIPWRG